MGLDTKERQNIVYFTGYEVEHTICYGKKTLFVVGTPPIDEILDKAKEYKVEHIYFGTSQSFNPKSMAQEEYKPWDDVIFGCLKNDYWVTLDFGVEHIEGVLESCYSENQKFVPMISVKLPYINQLNYNATLKLDDNTWGATNPGVWTHRLHELMDYNKFTKWEDYSNDN